MERQKEKANEKTNTNKCLTNEKDDLGAKTE